MLKKDRARKIYSTLQKTYPNAKCSLDFHNTWELLVATILSAQCTDKRVNMVTPALFKKFPTPQKMAKAGLPEIEKCIRTTGFYKNKAKALKGSAEKIVNDFHGHVPDTLEQLITMPGVARKTANVVLGVAFQKNEGVVVDTHVKRLSQRMGLTKHTDPAKIEKDLMQLFPQKNWMHLSHLFIDHGRAICKAPKPLCPTCPVKNICPSSKRYLSHEH